MLDAALKKILDDAISFIGSIDAVARHRIESRLNAYSDEEKKALVENLQKADRLAWFWSSWKGAAHAWLLAKMVQDDCLGVMSFEAPPDNKMTAYLNQLKELSDSEIRSGISHIFSGHSVVPEIIQELKNVSRNAWAPSVFGKPEAHQPGSFLYLVHAMRGSTGLGAVDQTRDEYMVRTLQNYVDVQSRTLWSAELYLQKPESLESAILCCSVIDPAHTKTYGSFPFGFILKVPKQNVCRAAGKDLNSGVAGMARADELIKEKDAGGRLFRVDEFLDELKANYSQALPTPQEVLSASTSHNEVIVIGTLPNFEKDPEGSQIKITGIFVKVTRNGKLLKTLAEEDQKLTVAGRTGLLELIKNCSRQRNIPIVNIPSDGEDSAVDFDTWKRAN